MKAKEKRSAYGAPAGPHSAANSHEISPLVELVWKYFSSEINEVLLEVHRKLMADQTELPSVSLDRTKKRSK
jgi:hypothetical protein